MGNSTAPDLLSRLTNKGFTRAAEPNCKTPNLVVFYGPTRSQLNLVRQCQGIAAADANYFWFQVQFFGAILTRVDLSKCKIKVLK